MRAAHLLHRRSAPGGGGGDGGGGGGGGGSGRGSGSGGAGGGAAAAAAGAGFALSSQVGSNISSRSTARRTTIPLHDVPLTGKVHLYSSKNVHFATAIHDILCHGQKNVWTQRKRPTDTTRRRSPLVVSVEVEK